LGIKLPRRGADHSPPPSAEVTNAWCYTSAPQYVFVIRRAWWSTGIQHKFFIL